MKYYLFIILVQTLLLSTCSNARADLPLSPAKDALSPDSSYKEIRKQLALSLKNGDATRAAICYQQIGDILFEEGAISQALSYYHKADGYFKKDKSLLNLGNNLNRIGKIYFKNRRSATALASFREALRVFQIEDNHRGIAESYGYIGQVYEQKGAHDSSHIYQELALSEFKSLNDKSQIAYTYSRIGSIYEDQGKFQPALKYFLAAYSIYWIFLSKVRHDSSESTPLIPGQSTPLSWQQSSGFWRASM